MFKEQLAIKVITSIVGKWETMKKKLEDAIGSLKEVVSNNNLKIIDLESKNNSLKNKITEAEKFKDNIDKMLK